MTMLLSVIRSCFSRRGTHALNLCILVAAALPARAVPQSSSHVDIVANASTTSPSSHDTNTTLDTALNTPLSRYPFAIPCPLASLTAPSLQIIVTQSPTSPTLSAAQLARIPALADQIVFYQGKFQRPESVVGEGVFVSVKPTCQVEDVVEKEGVTWTAVDKCLDAVWDFVKDGKGWGEMRWYVQLKTGKMTVAVGGIVFDDADESEGKVQAVE